MKWLLQYRSDLTAKRRADSREGMIVTTIALDDDLHQRLSIAAVEERAALTEVIREAAREWLDRRERTHRKKGGKA